MLNHHTAQFIILLRLLLRYYFCMIKEYYKRISFLNGFDRRICDSSMIHVTFMASFSPNIDKYFHV